MKKIKAVSMMLVIGIMAFAFMQKDAMASAATEKSQIKKAVEKQISYSESVRKILYADYDKNGRKEAFVLYGEQSGSWDTQYKLSFAYIKNNKVVIKLLRNDVLQYSKMLKLKSVTLFAAQTYATTSTPMDLYLVKGNKVQKIFHGDTISKPKGNTFTSVHSTYDGAIDEYGNVYAHTWKPYYFYYKKGRIYQYTAKRISISQFKKKYSNANKMLKKYKGNGKVTGILYRSNGLVHINYQKVRGREVDNINITFKTAGKKLIKPKKDFGIYLRKI